MTCNSVRSNVGLCSSDPRSNGGQTIKRLLAFRILKPVNRPAPSAMVLDPCSMAEPADGESRAAELSAKGHPVHQEPGGSEDHPQGALPSAEKSTRNTRGSSGWSGWRRRPLCSAGRGVSGVSIRWPRRTATLTPAPTAPSPQRGSCRHCGENEWPEPAAAQAVVRYGNADQRCLATCCPTPTQRRLASHPAGAG
jgi:hypothetical protein